MHLDTSPELFLPLAPWEDLPCSLEILPRMGLVPRGEERPAPVQVDATPHCHLETRVALGRGQGVDRLPIKEHSG